jgi:hypothetical protein
MLQSVGDMENWWWPYVCMFPACHRMSTVNYRARVEILTAVIIHKQIFFSRRYAVSPGKYLLTSFRVKQFKNMYLLCLQDPALLVILLTQVKLLYPLSAVVLWDIFWYYPPFCVTLYTLCSHIQVSYCPSWCILWVSFDTRNKRPGGLLLRFGDRIPVGRDFPPVQTGPGTHLASYTMGAGSSPAVKYGRGVLLTTHSLLVPWLWKSRVIPLLTLWATTAPVTGTLNKSPIS